MDDRLVIQKLIQDLLQKKGDTRKFSDTDLLFTSGRLSSADALDVVVVLEEKYSLDFSDSFDRDQIDSVANILALIGQR
jgi:acyl carrier protein